MMRLLRILAYSHRAGHLDFSSYAKASFRQRKGHVTASALDASLLSPMPESFGLALV